MRDVPPDYLLIGHVTRDRITGYGNSWRAGGTVLYAGVTAHRLGRRVGIVTALGPDAPGAGELDALDLVEVRSPSTTTFAIELGERRTLRLLARAADISIDNVPADWREAALVHLAPVAGEVPMDMATAFPASWVGATPQGWLRRCVVGLSVDRPAHATEWAAFRRVDAAVVSAEDLTDLRSGNGLVSTEERAEELGRYVPLLVVTRGDKGCIVVDRGQVSQVDPYPAMNVDSTGAGDVFAASFFVRLSETGDPIESARFAARVAALSVEGVGTSRIPYRADVPV